jgi:hypothetical protein
MRKSVKIAAVATVLLLTLGAVVLVYAGSQNGINANDDELKQMGIQNMQTFFESDNATVSCPIRRMPQMHVSGFQWTSFLENATISTVQGTVVSELKDMLILDTGSGQVRVLLPKDWTVDGEVVGRTELFNGTFASPSQSVTLKVLESDVFSNANFSINIMVGYEAINATAAHAYAVLPFNIQPHS